MYRISSICFDTSCTIQDSGISGFYRNAMELERKHEGAQTTGGGRPRSPRIHQAILKSAADLVLESGFRAISMDDIAARAKVGRMTIYRMAKVFRGKDGALIRALLAEAQFDPRLAAELRDRWTMPRRKMAIAYFQQGIKDGFLRPDVDPDAMIDILYAPLYYRLQMGTGPLSDAYVDEIFDHAMKGFRKS
jgi:AcrR family transcriptional regulator